MISGSFLGLDSWGVSTSGWGSGLVGLECANAQNSYCELLGGYQETNPEGVLYESWGGGYNEAYQNCRLRSSKFLRRWSLPLEHTTD